MIFGHRGLPALGILVVVALAASVLGQGVPTQAPVGDPPPAIRGVGKWYHVPKGAGWADKDAVRFDRLEGRVAIIEFGTSWCAGCRRIAPTLDSLHEKSAKKGLLVLGVTLADQHQSAEAIDDYVKKVEHPYAVLATGEAVRAYGVEKIPYAVVVGRDGKVAWKGNPDTHKAKFKRVVNRALRAK